MGKFSLKYIQSDLLHILKPFTYFFKCVEKYPEQAEIAIATSFLRRTLSVCGVKGQASTLLGRLELLGPGTAAAMKRRNYSLLLERRWAQLRQAHARATVLILIGAMTLCDNLSVSFITK